METESRPAFEGRLIGVRVDRVGDREFEVVEHPPAVAIIPVDEKGRVWLVRQRRHPVGGDLVEVPAGLIDTGETPVQAARRELLEECGVSAARLERLGAFFTSPGFTDERIELFLATGLASLPAAGFSPDPDVSEVVRMPVAAAIAQAERGEIPDLKTSAALLLARAVLARGG